MTYSVSNNNLWLNCFPLAFTLCNVAYINKCMNNKKIIRICVLLYGIIGGVILYNTLHDDVRIQTTIEWIGLCTILYYPAIEAPRLRSISMKKRNLFETKESSNEIIRFDDPASLLYDSITAPFYLIIGVIILIVVMFPFFNMLIDKSNHLYNLVKYNFIIASLSSFVVYRKKRVRSKTLRWKENKHE